MSELQFSTPADAISPALVDVLVELDDDQLDTVVGGRGPTGGWGAADKAPGPVGGW